MREELKPCPFCGNMGYAREEKVDGKTWYYFQCGTCASTTGRYGGYQSAKDRWNRRAQPANEPLTLEQLRGMIGQWVWVIVKYEHCECSGWALIAPNCLAYLDQTIPFAFYMKKAIAYLRPPEGSEG